MLVDTSPTRQRLIIQNKDTTQALGIFRPKDKPDEVLTVYPCSWIELEDKLEDADKEWWAMAESGTVGSININVVEVYEEPKGWLW